MIPLANTTGGQNWRAFIFLRPAKITLASAKTGSGRHATNDHQPALVSNNSKSSKSARLEKRLTTDWPKRRLVQNPTAADKFNPNHPIAAPHIPPKTRPAKTSKTLEGIGNRISTVSPKIMTRPVHQRLPTNATSENCDSINGSSQCPNKRKGTSGIIRTQTITQNFRLPTPLPAIRYKMTQISVHHISHLALK